MAWSCSVSSFIFRGVLVQCRYYPCCFPPGSFVFVNLSPVQLPSPAKAPGKFSAAITEMLLAEEKEDDHPDIREIRRRVAANLKEMVELGHI